MSADKSQTSAASTAFLFEKQIERAKGGDYIAAVDLLGKFADAVHNGDVPSRTLLEYLADAFHAALDSDDDRDLGTALLAELGLKRPKGRPPRSQYSENDRQISLACLVERAKREDPKLSINGAIELVLGQLDDLVPKEDIRKAWHDNKHLFENGLILDDEIQALADEPLKNPGSLRR